MHKQAERDQQIGCFGRDDSPSPAVLKGFPFLACVKVIMPSGPWTVKIAAMSISCL